MDTIFNDIKVIKLGVDTKISPEKIKDFKQIILENEDIYPGIDVWFKKRVIPGIYNGTREAFLVYRDNKLVGASLIKKGKRIKICSLRVKPFIQKKKIGSLLMDITLSTITDYEPRSVYFTISEEMWDNIGDFFTQYGFSKIGKYKKRYRNNASKEFIVNVDMADLIFNWVMRTKDIIMSIKPTYASKILEGSKTIEIRRRFSDKLANKEMLLYASKPIKSVVGSVRIKNVVQMESTELWGKYSKEIDIDRNEFLDYIQDQNKVYAIFLENPVVFTTPIKWDFLKEKNNIVPPRSYRRLRLTSI